ncbi:uncharacterized protein LOC118755625 [Rhagoletis pomonella]|uniref:uncharacterized protein LOC118755625 n=1 Tax=Rhagoletis pomonella TaxID=28610 RepID=UPI00178369D0|nr:uncharacterized protein LOC118755625 [Rhagoletis pomonella]
MNENKEKDKKKSRVPRARRSANWSAEETLRFVRALVDVGRDGILNQATNGCTPEQRAQEYRKIANILNAERASTGIVREPLHLQNRFKQIKQYLQTYSTWQRQVSMGTGGGLAKPMPVSLTVPLTGAMLELLAILRDRFCGLHSEFDSDMVIYGSSANSKEHSLLNTEALPETQMPDDTHTPLYVQNKDVLGVQNTTLEEVQIVNITEALPETQMPDDTHTPLYVENKDVLGVQNTTLEEVQIVNITAKPSSTILTPSCNFSSPLIVSTSSPLPKEASAVEPRQYFATVAQQRQARKRRFRDPNNAENEMRQQLINLELTQSRELHATNMRHAIELHTANMEAVMLQKTAQKQVMQYFAKREQEAQERHNLYLKTHKPMNAQESEKIVQEELEVSSFYDDIKHSV